MDRKVEALLAALQSDCAGVSGPAVLEIAIVPVTGVVEFFVVTPSANGSAFASAGGSESAVIATLGMPRAPGGVKM